MMTDYINVGMDGTEYKPIYLGYTDRVVIAGSTAIKFHFSDFRRDPDDLDYVCTDKNLYKKEHKVERKEIPCIWKYIDESQIYLTPDQIYTLKCSHIFWDIKQNKHLSDINFLQNKGCKIIEPMFWDLYAFWQKVHGPRKGEPDFKKSNEDFFMDKVKRDITHDELHEYFKTKEHPQFWYIKHDKTKAEVDEQLFNELSFEDKCNIIYEECFVLSLERFLIPGNVKFYVAAYHYALRMLILRLFPIYIAKFLVENYILLSKPPYNFWKSFKDNRTIV